jgi:hypothetical protein
LLSRRANLSQEGRQSLKALFKANRMSVTIREGTTVPAKRAPGCHLWVAVNWHPAAWLGNAS